MFLQTYAASIWVYVAIRQIASNLALVPICVEQQQKGGKYVAVADHPAQMILDNPRSRISGSDFVEQATTYMETCGSELIVCERRNVDPIDFNPNAEVLAYTPLRPSQVTIVPDSGTPGGVKRYEYNVGGTIIPIDYRNADFYRYFDPNNDWWGLSPISVLRTVIGIDANLEKYNQSTVDNGGIPDLVLETEQAVARSNAKRITREFEQKHMRSGKSGGIVLLDAGLKVKPIGLPPKDMQFPDTAEFTQNRILAAFGVPPILAMDVQEASVLANADVQIKLFFKFTLPRTGRPLAESLTRQIRRDFKDPRLRVRFAFEQADATRDSDKERDATMKGYDSGIVTKNEARSVLGLDPVTDGGEDFKAPAPSPFGGAGDFPAKGAGRRARATPEFKAMARVAYRRLHDSATAKLREPMRTFFKDQRARVLAKFETLKSELGPFMGMQVAAGAKPSTQKAIFDDAMIGKLFSTQEESRKFVLEVGPVFLSGMVDAANEKMRDLLPSTRRALKDSHLPFQDFYSRWGATKVVEIQDATRAAIQGAVQDGFNEGLSTREIENRIGASFKDLVDTGQGDETETDFPEYRLERIARTEAGTMLNKGSFEGVKDLVAHGSNIKKSWLSSRDQLVRDSHAAVDEETTDNPIPAMQEFSNGLMFPNDPSGPAEEVIQCRCSLIEEVIDTPEEG
jgi:HK97 family phage portal protein